MADNVNHPDHYEKFCSLECIEAMEIAFGADAVLQFCKLNAFKYVWRWKNKNGREDLEKAKWYVNQARRELANGTVNRWYEEPSLDALDNYISENMNGLVEP